MLDLNSAGLSVVPLGQVIKSRLVTRCDVADGTKGRAILASQDVIGCNLVYTPEPHRGVYFVDPPTAIKYNLSPRFYYLIPLVRLNTDARGNVINSSVSLEYLRLSEGLYRQFVNDLEELEVCKTIALTKESKGEFSYVVPKPSSKDYIPDEFKSSINDFLTSLDTQTLFNYIMADVARPFTQYISILDADGTPPESSELSKTPLSHPSLPSSLSSNPSSLPSFDEEDEFASLC